MSDGGVSGRLVLVAGATSASGHAVTRALVAAGARVVAVGHDPDKLVAVAALGAIVEACDLTDEAAVLDLVGRVHAGQGRVDGVLHLVGGWRGGQPLHEEPLADWDLLHALLIRTVQLTTRAFHDQLAASAHGRFVLVSAKQAQRPSNGNAAYAAAKAAAEAWTLAYADGFGHGGATANIVVVEAILTAQMRAENPGKEFPTFTPTEHIADAIAWLCSDGAAEMNGTRLALTMP